MFQYVLYTGARSPIVTEMEEPVLIKASRFSQGRQILVAAVVIALSCFSSPAWAACVSTGTVFCDNAVGGGTQVAVYKGTAFQSGYTSNGFIGGVGNAIQSPYHPFDTDKLFATLEQGRTTTFLELKFYTSFDGSELGANFADIFLGKGKTDTFGYAVSLGQQTASGGNNGGLVDGLYSVSSYKTSQDLWSASGDYYGGRYKGFDGGWHKSPTVLTAGTKKDLDTLGNINESSVITTTPDDGNFSHLVDVKIAMKTTDFIQMFGNQGLSVFWGTADCSNDPIEAFIAYSPTTHIPEPMTLAVFGAGVGAFASIRRRRKSEAS